jgi:hypothetical protein
MSADNYIAMQKIGWRWYVWHESASNELPFVPIERAIVSWTHGRALKNVGELYDECMIVEYGVQNLPSYKNWVSYYRDAVDAYSKNFWETIDAIQGRERAEASGGFG